MPASALPSRAIVSPGIRAMAIGAWWFAVMGLFVKLAGRRLPSSQIVLVRAALTLAMSWWAVCQAAAMVGVVLITRPAFLFGSAASSYDTRDVAIALLGAVSSGAAYAAVR